MSETQNKGLLLRLDNINNPELEQKHTKYLRHMINCSIFKPLELIAAIKGLPICVSDFLAFYGA